MEGTIGEIRMFAAAFAPKNWNYCDGSIIAISRNTALFSILGTTYGGNGQTTFGLPNLCGRVALGAGNAVTGSVYALGEKAGTNTTTLSANNLPPHAHTGIANIAIPAYSEGGDVSSPSNANFSYLPGMYAKTHDSNLSPFNATIVDGTTGSNMPFNNMKAYVGMNYIICMYGVFPSRN